MTAKTPAPTPDPAYTPEQIAAAAELGITVEAMDALLRGAYLEAIDEVLAGFEFTPEADAA